MGQLPYGLQKRVDLGRALAMEPQVLLLDEPMAGMNVEEKQDMCRFVLDVNDEFGTTVVLIEHDMGVVMDISDRVVVLDYGKKIGDGTPDEVRNNPDVIRAYLGTTALRQPTHGILSRNDARRPDGRHAVFAGGARLRADLQGLGRVQFRAGRDGAVRRAGDGAIFRMVPAMDRHRQRVRWPTGRVRRSPAPIMFAVAWLIERLVLRQLVNQEGATLLMATLGIAYFLEGLGQTLFGSDIYKIDIGMPKDPMMAFEVTLRGRHAGEQGRPVSPPSIAAALVPALSLFFQKTGTGRALRAVADDHQAAQSIGIPLNRIWVIVWCVAGVVALVAGMIWGSKLGVQFSLAHGGPARVAGGDPRRPHLGAGRDHRRADHRRRRKAVGGLPRAAIVGGGIEIWFAYVLALGFLLVRPQGLFGEKIIDRV